MIKLDRTISAIAIVALLVWIGGLLALGAVAAPMVFGIVPAPWSGDAMGATFRRFDGVAAAAAVVALGCEAVLLKLRGDAGLLDRARSGAIVLAAAAAFYQAIVLSPGILALHAAHAVRGLGEDGLALARLHDLAELGGKLQALVGLSAVVLHVVTIRPTAR